MSHASALWAPIRGALLLLFGAALVRSAWLAEDAYITLRTIDNFWHGYGLRWNVLERVQTYTHPLWMLIVGAVYGVTREAAFTTIGVSLACAVVMAWLLVRTLSPLRACVALTIMVSSRAFVSFSTSGLENPLSHLLLVAFWLLYLRDLREEDTSARPDRRLASLAKMAGLIGMTRLDLVVIVAPAVLIEAWRLWRTRPAHARGLPRLVAALACGSIPFIAWHLFALVYYGFPFPNTAYAKLATGIPNDVLFSQGLRYLKASFIHDPVTPIVIAAGIAAACTHSVRRALALGIPLVLYLAYVVRIGGDFMTGRFLTAPFICAVLAIATARWAERQSLSVGVIAVTALIGIAMPDSPLHFWRQDPPATSAHGQDEVVDEQMFYYEHTGLLPMLRGRSPQQQVWSTLGRSLSSMPRAVVHINIGLLGYYSGPGPHLIDEYALGDPLLARLPAIPGARVGHYKRVVPDWYKPFLDRCIARLYPAAAVRPTGDTCLPHRDELTTLVQAAADPRPLLLYRDLLLVTQGPLLDRERLRTIVRLNLHRGGVVTSN